MTPAHGHDDEVVLENGAVRSIIDQRAVAGLAPGDGRGDAPDDARVRLRSLQVPEVPSQDVLEAVAACVEPGRRAAHDGVVLGGRDLVLRGLGRASQVVERDTRMLAGRITSVEDRLEGRAAVVLARQRRRAVPLARAAGADALGGGGLALIGLLELLFQYVELGAEAGGPLRHRGL